MEASYAHFTRAFESLLGRMPVEALSGLPALPPQAAREQLASYVGPLDFTLFQKLDHGAIVTALGGNVTKSIKEIVLEVLRRSFVERDPTVVAEYFGANYKQHNPVIADGPSAIARMIPTLTGLTYEL